MSLKGIFRYRCRRNPGKLYKSCYYTCISILYGHTYSKSKDQPGKVANPAHGQLNRDNAFSLSTFTPENLVSRDGFGSPVPRQPAHHLRNQAESDAYYAIPPEFRGGVHLLILNRHTPYSTLLASVTNLWVGIKKNIFYL